jgi:hypothetical protein
MRMRLDGYRRGAQPRPLRRRREAKAVPAKPQEPGRVPGRYNNPLRCGPASTPNCERVRISGFRQAPRSGRQLMLASNANEPACGSPIE